MKIQKEFANILMANAVADADVALAMTNVSRFMQVLEECGPCPTVQPDAAVDRLVAACDRVAPGLIARLDLNSQKYPWSVVRVADCEYGTSLPLILALKLDDGVMFAKAAQEMRLEIERGETLARGGSRAK